MKHPLAPAVLTVALLIGGCSGDETPRVQVAEVSRGAVDEVVEAPGNVAARATATVSAPADAVVEAVLVQDGEPVTGGQILVRLVSPSAQDRLRAAESAAANAAAAQVELPQADLGGVQDALDAAAQSSFDTGRAVAAQLVDPDLRHAAEQQVDVAERDYWAAADAARAAVASLGSGVGSVEGALNAVGDSQRAQAQAGVTSARAVVDSLTVLAPIDGVVTLGAGTAGGAPAGGGDLAGLIDALPPEVAGQAEQLTGGAGPAAPQTASVELAVGTPVSSGSPLLTVTDLAGLTVAAEVDETDVLLVQPGVQAEVQLDAVPDAVYPATVSSVDVAPTTSGQGGVSYRVRLALAEGRLDGDEVAPQPRPGMSAVVALQVRSSPTSSLAVPAAAVLRDGVADAVLVVEGDRVRRRDVRLGAQGEDRVEVLSGLRAGDRVVARDVDVLQDGQTVEP